MRTVTVVIPTYNEAENIGRLVEAVFCAARRIPSARVEVLVVDDSSPDGTGKIVRSLARRDDRLHLLTGQKAGLGTAYLRGFAYAMKRFRPYAVVMMDADMSHDPEAIPALIQALDAGADYVIGSRYVHGGTIPGNWPLLRILNSRVANALVKRMVDPDQEVADITGGFKAMRGSFLARVMTDTIQASGYVFQVSLLHAFIKRGAVVREVPITFVDRQFGESKLKLRDVAEFIYRVYQLNPEAPFRRMWSFAMVGASGAMINLGMLFLTVDVLHAPVLIAAMVALEASIISNFWLNEALTFSARSMVAVAGVMRRLARFNAGALVGAGIAFSILSLLYMRFAVGYMMADVFAILGGMSWNYWMSTRLVWRLPRA